MRRLSWLFVLVAVPARALELAAVSLPSPTATPSLLFAPADVAALAGRRTDPAYAPYYNRVKQLADGQLAANLGAAAFGDDLSLAVQSNNLSVRAGAALVSAAMALPDHADAGGWLAKGLDDLGRSLRLMASDTGWYREGPHYLNYALNNLVSAAW